MNTLERLKEYIEYHKIPMAVFERKVGMANASLSKTLENGKGIRSDSLENILSTCPDLSAEWLLRGTGNMLVGEVTHDNEHDSKFKQFQDKVFRMSSNKEQMNMAYDIAMSALDLVGKTYDFFSKKGE